MGACIEHKRYKKGSCADCEICRYCRPPEECNNKRNHFNWIREARRSGHVEAQNPQGLVTPRRGKRSSSLRGKKRIRMNEYLLFSVLVHVILSKKMEDTLASHEIKDVDVNDASIGLVEAEREFSAMAMLDPNDEGFRPQTNAISQNKHQLSVDTIYIVHVHVIHS